MTMTTLSSIPAAQVADTRRPWMILFARTLLFLGWQAVIALIFQPGSNLSFRWINFS